jgi:hypothetical protein
MGIADADFVPPEPQGPFFFFNVGLQLIIIAISHWSSGCPFGVDTRKKEKKKVGRRSAQRKLTAHPPYRVSAATVPYGALARFPPLLDGLRTIFARDGSHPRTCPRRHQHRDHRAVEANQERRQQGSPSRASKSKRKRHHRPTRRAISVAPSKDESNCKNSPGSSNYKNARPFCTAKHLPFCPAKHTRSRTSGRAGTSTGSSGRPPGRPQRGPGCAPLRSTPGRTSGHGPGTHSTHRPHPRPKHCGFRTPQHRSHGQVQSCIASTRAPKCSRYLPVRTATRSE